MRLTTLLKQISKVEDGVSSEAVGPTGAAALQAGLSRAVANGQLAPLIQYDAASASRCVGFIDRIGPDAIHGWAYDKLHPEGSVTVEAVTNNGKRVVALANLLREDVASAGHGTGRYGFVLDLSKLCLKDETIMVRFADSKYPIAHEPIEFDAQRAVLRQSMPQAFVDVMVLLAAQVRIAAERSNDLDAGLG